MRGGENGSSQRQPGVRYKKPLLLCLIALSNTCLFRERMGCFYNEECGWFVIISAAIEGRITSGFIAWACCVSTGNFIWGIRFFQYREHKMSRLITEVPECFRSSFIPCIIWHFFSTRGQSVQMFPQEKVTTPLTSICFLKCDLCFGYVTQIR